MVLVLDNYDSFTFNLVQYLGELGAEVAVRRNDSLRVDDVVALAPSHVVISPGPGHPADAGISVPLVRALAGRVPILGVCLGHQAIGHAFGGRVAEAPAARHGKTSQVTHDGRGVFAGVASPFEAGRYHSLAVAAEQWPEALEACAYAADDGVVMGLRHKTWPVHGLQFHPESMLTGEGRRLLRNFLEGPSSCSPRC